LTGWQAERFGKVARRLGERQQIPSLIVWRGKRGGARAEIVAANSGGHALVAPPLSLSEIAELIRKSDLALSCDRDLLDFAADQGTAAVHPLSARKGRDNTEIAEDITADEVAEKCIEAMSKRLDLRFTRAA
jgi:hypothetical protein